MTAVHAIAALVSVNIYNTLKEYLVNCRRIASFHHLALTETSSTDHIKINTMLYQSVLEKSFPGPHAP